MAVLRNQGFAVVGTSSVQLIGSTTERHGLIVSAPVTNRVTLSFAGSAVLDQGINLHPGQAPLYITREAFGEALCEPVSAVCAAGTETIGWLEFID